MSVLGVGGIYVNKATMSMLGIDVINEETVSGGGGEDTLINEATAAVRDLCDK